MKYIALIGLLACCYIIYSVTRNESINTEPCITQIKYAGKSIYKSELAQKSFLQEETYFYVYDFEKKSDCYQKIIDLIDSLKIDTSKGQAYLFYKYEEGLPDTLNIYNASEYSNYGLMNYEYNYKNKKTTIIYWDGGKIGKVIDMDWYNENEKKYNHNLYNEN